MRPPTEQRTKAKRETAFRSSLYQEFLAERDEILRHKWLESEKAGFDVGFERALLDWIRNHRDAWRAARRQRMLEERAKEAQAAETKSKRSA